ncbi:MAG TPA: type IV-A pilus assembly ATPase PilB [Methylomirabilota bacterium]|jgi:type IV pilus assembly protein PilB|nr:type IV-A pilus assembly ATPase PilB [Methylomirabilota bacterium]
MAQTESKPLSPEEKRSLAESARLCEMIVEANPSDTGALETLKEIYTKLGDRENLARVVARLAGTVGGRPSASVTPTPEVVTAPAPSPAPAPVVELEPAIPSGDNGRGAGKRAAVIASERRGGSLSRLGDRLVAEKLISTEQLQRALAEQKGSADKLGTILVRLGFITEDSLVSFLSKQYSIPAITVAQVDPDPDVLKLVPEQIAKKHSVLPIKRMGNVLTLAMADPTNVFALDDVGFMTGLQIQPVVASEAAIRKAFERLYETGASVTDMMSELEEADTDVEVVEGGEETFTKADVFDLKESADEAPVVRLINMILTDAIRRGASDIHLEPYEKVFRVRFRIDGVLHEIMTPPKRLEAALTSRVKIMATLDIAERRLPQDGRIKLRYHQREIDFRVSTLPTIFGEKTVMRILDKDALQLDLTALGFDPWSMEQFTKAIHSPYGMILITGPTGSGKTTTLYSAIHTINSPDINIMTAEDPVEYNLKGVNQVQVNDEIGRTFAACLRSFLRQDPDVILVGETRDLETAQIGIRAALTGHLVLSTLHTNDCPSTPARLLDMGIPPFLVSSSLQLILAQRLGRRVCRDCKEPYEASEESLVPYGHVPQGLGTVNFYKGKGCQTCNFTGMKGRVAIYEVMPISTEIRDLILRNATTNEIQDAACSQGMKTLRQNALQKVIDGVTTVEEVLRVTLG